MSKFIYGIAAGAVLALALAFTPVLAADSVVYGNIPYGAMHIPTYCPPQGYAVSVGGTLTETALYSCTIPAGALSPNAILRLSYMTTYQATTNTKTITPKFNTTALYTSNRTSASQYGDNMVVYIYLRNSLASQVFSASIGTGMANGAISYGTIDFAQTQTFSLTATTSLETGFTPTTGNMSGTGVVVTVVYTAHGLSTGDYIKAAGSSTGGYNVDPVSIVRVDANTFQYLGTGTGTPATAPTIQRYSNIKLEGLVIEVLRP